MSPSLTQNSVDCPRPLLIKPPSPCLSFHQNVSTTTPCSLWDNPLHGNQRRCTQRQCHHRRCAPVFLLSSTLSDLLPVFGASGDLAKKKVRHFASSHPEPFLTSVADVSRLVRSLSQRSTPQRCPYRRLRPHKNGRRRVSETDNILHQESE